MSLLDNKTPLNLESLHCDHFFAKGGISHSTEPQTFGDSFLLFHFAIKCEYSVLCERDDAGILQQVE